MTTQTTDSQIAAMKELAETLSKSSPITSCVINDWGRFGNFELFIQVAPAVFKNTRKNILTRQINKLIENALKTITADNGRAHRRETFSPEATRKTRYGRTEVTYDRTSWHVDIDFHPYNHGTNSFQV